MGHKAGNALKWKSTWEDWARKIHVYVWRDWERLIQISNVFFTTELVTALGKIVCQWKLKGEYWKPIYLNGYFSLFILQMVNNSEAKYFWISLSFLISKNKYIFAQIYFCEKLFLANIPELNHSQKQTRANARRGTNTPCQCHFLMYKNNLSDNDIR